MWSKNWRQRLWSTINQPKAKPWDIIVVGGGITGVGILREAARAGVRVLLVERADFASGTSSWSSKLVHGGLRYLASGDWKLTLESVRERQALLQAAPGLVEPLDFLLPMYAGQKPGRLMMGAALGIYDLMARKRYSRYLGSSAAHERVPQLNTQDLRGAFSYTDARTDDTRLVMRVLSEALEDGGVAANYISAESVLRENGRVVGIFACDSITGQSAEIRADVVINATGPWSDELRAQVDAPPRIRPLRGSHFIFSAQDLPIQQALTLTHPQDNRLLFALPWEGASLFGTTDLDHKNWPDQPAKMTSQEAGYLEAALAHYFPALHLDRGQAISAYSGVRPIASSGADSPGQESRESAIWSEQGLLSVTGGKLTTFRVTALEALRELTDYLPALKKLTARAPLLNAVVASGNRRLSGRYGEAAARMHNLFDCEAQVPGSMTYWAELHWAARFEAVETLGDLMLRRTRLGLLLPRGGEQCLEDVGVICRAECGWDDARWERERDRYMAHWQAHHDPAARHLNVPV